MLARTSSKLEQVAAEIRRTGGRAYVYPVDVADAGAINRCAQQIIREVGVPDILVNNAGSGRWLSIEETCPEEAATMMAAPYLAAFYVTRAFLPEMLKRDSGAIVNLTSIASRIVWPGATAYTVGRWAMRGFTQALEADLSDTRIRTTLVTFAAVRSAYWENNPGSEMRVPKAQTLIPIITTEQAAAAILKGIQRNQREVIAPMMLQVVVALSYLFPFVTRRLMILTGYKRKARFTAANSQIRN